MPSAFHFAHRAFIAILFTLAGCGRRRAIATSPAVRIEPAVGCYELISAATDSLDVGPLQRFRLQRDTVLPSGRHARMVELLFEPASPGPSQFVCRFWDVDPVSDTIRVSIGSGFTGQFFRGVSTPSGDLEGVSGFFGDTGPPFEHDIHVATARRIACPP